MGETSVLADGARTAPDAGLLARACEIYAERFAGPDGRIAATFEIITLTGWAPHPDQHAAAAPRLGEDAAGRRAGGEGRAAREIRLSRRERGAA